MFSYFAFKGLRADESGLYSPQQKTCWRQAITPWGEFMACEAAARDLENGFGVFAADYDEAAQYAETVYLVFPDPNKKVILGELGWRAERAFVYCKVNNCTEIARLILDAQTAGYPQLNSILFWAIAETKNPLSSTLFETIVNNLYTQEFKHSKLIYIEDRLLTAVLSSKENLVPFLLKLCEKGSRYLKQSIAYALSRSTSVSFSEMILVLSVLAKDPDHEVRVAVADAIVLCPHEVLLPIAEILCNDKDYTIVRFLVSSVLRLGEKAIDILEKLSEHPHPDVRRVVAIAANRIGLPALSVLRK